MKSKEMPEKLVSFRAIQNSPDVAEKLEPFSKLIVPPASPESKATRKLLGVVQVELLSVSVPPLIRCQLPTCLRDRTASRDSDGRSCDWIEINPRIVSHRTC